ncbi:hypothetical protein AK812_SmicGene19519 [Symbiodinium microadriaticum]|uniref:Uncharacterized protein n=1 Tax=Symbiodinium microadriaticum TaxID=2951 RepID=A0A1Q9DSC1_SYMMI|nr:hypothetical protein AK812_SmicGene19519 [Symbiodinium microadriaticum]
MIFITVILFNRNIRFITASPTDTSAQWAPRAAEEREVAGTRSPNARLWTWKDVMGIHRRLTISTAETLGPRPPLRRQFGEVMTT